MPGQEVDGATAEEQNRESRDPETLDNPDEGPTMSGAGAEPAGNSMSHWATAMPNTDATKPETMPNTGDTQTKNETDNPA